MKNPLDKGRDEDMSGRRKKEDEREEEEEEACFCKTFSPFTSSLSPSQVGAGAAISLGEVGGRSDGEKWLS